MAEKLCQLKKKGGGGGGAFSSLITKVVTTGTSSSAAAVKVSIDDSNNNNIADINFLYTKIPDNSFLGAFSISYSNGFKLTVLATSLKINGVTYTQNQTVTWTYNTSVDYLITDIIL